ncbi:MAG: serine/threonine-protein phosphatase, partial [Bacteroidales bacterium]|nr:serine/threonine-protein phosphatase [Bacteroidales bacterium]
IDDPRIHPEDPAYEFFAGQGSLLSIPLFDGGTGLNTVVISREEPQAFPRETVPELVWMCNLFNRAMQTLVLSDRLREAYDAADYELRTIADLQQSLLPDAVPNVPGLEIAVHSRTADQAGGDYYDYFPLPEGRLGVLIADVSGHGTPAAVLMSITHSLAHAVPNLQSSPSRMLAHLNSHLSRRYTKSTGAFVTGFYAVFDPHSQSLTYASAGHLPPRICRAGEGRWRPLSAAHRLPLGVNPRDGVYPEQTVAFAPGDRVALYTDGIVECTDVQGEPYGYEHLDAALARSGLKAQEAVREVLADLDAFGAGIKLADDRTLVVIRRTEC